MTATDDDLGAFAEQYIAQAPQADLNQDGVCNASDLERFINTYACGFPETP